MGAGFSFADGKQELIKLIENTVTAQKPPPRVFAPLEPSDGRMSTKPPRFTSTPQEMQEIVALHNGLRLSFPTVDTWFLEYGRKENSGSMHMPLRDFYRLVREFVR